MKRKVPIQQSADREFRYRMMRETINAVYEYKEDIPGKLWAPLMYLIATFIDGLASGDRPKYIRYLKKHFPELCADLGAEVFYTKYRNKGVHEFNFGKGFGIALGEEIKNAYVGPVRYGKKGNVMTCVNIQRLVKDFLAHIRSLEHP